MVKLITIKFFLRLLEAESKLTQCDEQTIDKIEIQLPIPINLPNPPDWTLSQVEKFLKISPVGEMLE